MVGSDRLNVPATGTFRNGSRLSAAAKHTRVPFCLGVPHYLWHVRGGRGRTLTYTSQNDQRNAGIIPSHVCWESKRLSKSGDTPTVALTRALLSQGGGGLA